MTIGTHLLVPHVALPATVPELPTSQLRLPKVTVSFSYCVLRETTAIRTAESFSQPALSVGVVLSQVSTPAVASVSRPYRACICTMFGNSSVVVYAGVKLASVPMDSVFTTSALLEMLYVMSDG